MADGVEEPQTQVFVLRCWREADAVLQPWRIQVEHVPTGRRVPLTDLGRLRPMLEEYLQGTGPHESPHCGREQESPEP